MGRSDSDDDDEDDTAGLQAQAATLLAPVLKQQKKQGKKIDKLELLIEQLKRVGDEQLPNLRNDNMKSMAEATVRLERVQSEVATLASKTSLELVREEQNATEQRLRKALDEERSKVAAQDLVIQGLTSRMDAMERAMRASELKVGSELAAAVAQLGQLSAALERHKGENEARVSEVSARATTQHDGLLLRLAQSEDRGRELQTVLATKAELGELSATVSRRAGEADAGVQAAHEQWRKANETLEQVQTSLASSYARVSTVEQIDQKLEALTVEARHLIEEAHSQAEKQRGSWEDKLLQRQLSLEKEAQAARRDWHQLSAQVEQCQTHVTERALLVEHEALAKAVEDLRGSTASKDELGQVRELATSAATGSGFSALENDVKQLQTWAREDEAKLNDLKANTPSAAEHTSLDTKVGELTSLVENKFGLSEAQFALSNKLDKGLGDQIGAEVEAMQQRLTALNERANGVELAMSKADSSVNEARRLVDSIKSDQQELGEKQSAIQAESHDQGTSIHDLVKAVRALTADAEMRAALDEREIEFLWAAPSHIYGSHGWRPNNGSKSERTPYPAGNFKMAVRHGSEGHARDVLAQRRKWLNSITVGRRAAEAMESDAAAAGTEPEGLPIRLPDIDEVRRHAHTNGSGSRAESPRLSPVPHGANSLLEPAHRMLNAHPPTLGGGVGVAPTRHRTRVSAQDAEDPRTY